MKLYRRERVEAIEASQEFRVAIQKAEARKAAANKGVETKVSKLDEYLDNLMIEVPQIDKERLIEAARQNFYSLDRLDRDLRQRRECA